MSMNAIIVLGFPQIVTDYSFYNPAPSPGFLSHQQQVAYANSVSHVDKEPDVTSVEITVVAQRLKTALINWNVLWMNRVGSGVRPFPCVGGTKNSEITSLLQRMRFMITNDEFGSGRGGENNVGSDGGNVPVRINDQVLVGYDALPGGLDFLIAHEIAHALKSMQEYNHAQWTSYINGPGANLGEAQQIAQYPGSAQFSNNEARANTVARAILNEMSKAMQFTPTKGFQVC